MRFDRLRRVCVALLVVVTSAPSVRGTSALAAQEALEGAGTVATGLLLRQMDGVKRVLMIAAHPDDEDTAFLTRMARGLGAETAYLALTRGDGGQNLIGPELWEGLGVIRTGELLAARELDGGLQFFTRAFDYGFSKTADEALSLWPREELLADVVWIVRKFRPHVIVSVFTGTPRDGHGQHQAAGIIAREAYAAAGDPSRFPEQLEHGVEAWAPLKIFQTSRRRFEPGEPAVDSEIVIPTGDQDPLLGRSSFQLAMESRSQHRSQDMGAAQPPGPRNTSVILVDARVPNPDEGIFSGIDTTLAGLAARLPEPSAGETLERLRAYRAAVGRVREGFGLDPSIVVDDLAEALGALQHARAASRPAGDAEVDLALAHKERVATKALMAAAGVVFDVRAEDDVVVPGEVVRVEATVWNGGDATVVEPGVALTALGGWPARQLSVEGLAGDGGLAAGTLATWTFEVAPPPDAKVSRLYYLEQEREGAWYQWPPDAELWGLPRNPPAVQGEVVFALSTDGTDPGMDIRHAVPWRFVGVDQARGEFEEPVLVLPAMSVRVTPQGMVWPQLRSAPRTLTVTLHAEAEHGAQGELALQAPAGWSVAPESYTFDLAGAGAERTLSFQIAPTASVPPGEHTFRAVARTADGRRYEESYAIVDYEHVARAALFEPAESRATVVPVRVAEGLRVGYIMGTGDGGPEAIRQMGAEVELLSENQVRDGDFDDFDVLVLGVRAYEARPDVRAANQQILDFARAGGTVVNQYNQYQFSDGGYAPDSLVIGRPAPRVALETAPVRILAPDAPVFTMPNEITQADFDGWVQERGLYFASEWGSGYVPMLEMNDPGEEARRGSLLVASVGEGVYVYAALSFFRQWDGQVPGAYRLFANLISLDADSWRAWLETR